MALASSPTSLVFKVERREPELIIPAEPTPHEFKYLSDIDDQEGLRFHIPLVSFYPNKPSMQGKDPAKVIREAVAKTLVFYYPFAGRLREGPNRKLMVECTGEGILFIEADADATLQHFGDSIHPPFPCLDELLFDVPGSSECLDCPLVLIQVTRLRCGGFIFAFRYNHTMSDASGVLQFICAIGEMARGAHAPSIPAPWERHILCASIPPRVTCRHREYEEVPASTKGTIMPIDHIAHKPLFFGPEEISALRRLVPPHLSGCSTFEVLTACLWKCRTIALQPHPEEEMRLICAVNARKIFNPPLPLGYYGNSFGLPVAVATAGDLAKNPLGFALELMKKTKAEVTEEYMRSLASLMVTRGRPRFTIAGTYAVSDVRYAGSEALDIGWGKAIYAGPAKHGVESSFYIPYANNKGEKGILVLLCLPRPAMEIFERKLAKMLKD
ncbi:hypothetical protein Tsubulata_022563 [Turnera subulata]|uniref:Benzyl alcohol O-benzoyltransferase n=1 Tax=Turnera subulata TaxID=218843 RepID=A0A9Q0JQK0_9ROSI|nr:hypothetical protein Tsubulata_022563 [Turnera subulata]